MFAFNFALNYQWAEQGSVAAPRQAANPDSLFIANGHYWVDFDIDPVTGAEIPVSLKEKALREGKDPNFYIEEFGHAANERIQTIQEFLENARAGSIFPSHSYYAAEGVELKSGEINDTFYSEKDRKFWERLNNTPGYPGTGEGNLLLDQSQEARERELQTRDRRSYGSMAFLFATPPGWGSLKGKALGGLRMNLVYRFYTGTPIDFTPTILDPKVPGGLRRLDALQRPGPMHTRVDLNAEKLFGDPSKVTFTLALEVFNLFNRQDVRSTLPGVEMEIDFNSDRWQQWGIEGLAPLQSAFVQSAEINDINNYWDAPREMRFSVRVKW